MPGSVTREMPRRWPAPAIRDTFCLELKPSLPAQNSVPDSLPSRESSNARARPHPGAVARLRAAVKVARAQSGLLERSLRVAVITDPRQEAKVPTILNTGTEILFNRRFLKQVADGSRRLHDILTIEFARAATAALGKRARAVPGADPDPDPEQA